MISPYSRSHVPLDGNWHYIVDPLETGFRGMFGEEREDGFFRSHSPRDHWASEYDFDHSPVLKVPGDWNSQNPELKWYEGMVWYQRRLPDIPQDERRRFLRFGGVNYAATVWLNGIEICRHVGGFTPFVVEITRILQRDGNVLVVRADNERHADAVPTRNFDWWNCGGITREVLLVDTPECYIRDFSCQLDPDDPNRVKGRVSIDGGDLAEVTISVSELDLILTAPVHDGCAEFSFPFTGEFWSPEVPRRYLLKIDAGADSLSEMVGFRSVTTRGEDILINGNAVFLRGICVHEEALHESRRATSEADARELLHAVKALGCNFARLAHYPHNDHMARVADELGIVLWCEIPVYWAVDFASEKTLQNARNQLCEMIDRDRNRASVILWSVANETPAGEARNAFLVSLVRAAKSSDPTRLTTAAMFMRNDEVERDGEVHRSYTVDDPLAGELDVMGCNQYLGWYYTRVAAVADASWHSAENKPLIMSEFGAAAKAGYRSETGERWSEDHQVNVYTAQFQMMRGIDFLRGTSPWILKDFRSPKRPLAGIQDYYNRKGLLSETGEKKAAWQVVADFYTESALRNRGE